MQNIWSIPKLTREYWRLGRAALTEHADCLTRKDLIKYYYPWLTSVLFHLDPIAYAGRGSLSVQRGFFPA